MHEGILLMRLEGPLQSWGTSSRFEERDTRREPSKSGVIGLVCAAFGLARDDPRAGEGGDLLGRMRALRMAVRVDREGVLWRDLHAAQFEPPLRLPRGAKPIPPGAALRSVRTYLSDASFVVALAGERALLQDIDGALRSPRWPLFLGRRGCPPSRPVAWGGLAGPGPAVRPVEDGPGHLLALLPLDARTSSPDPWLRIVEDAESGIADDFVLDVPVSLAPRRFAGRLTRTRFVQVSLPHVSLAPSPRSDAPIAAAPAP